MSGTCTRHANRRLALLLGCSIVAAAGFAEPDYHTSSTRKLLQLTGDTDTPLRKPALNLTETNAGLQATDLGSSFEHEGNLYFLFGDSRGRPGDRDAIAYSTSVDPTSLTITFPLALDGKFRPIDISEISQGAFCVPSYGISVGGNIYIVHTTDWYGVEQNMERSVLARSADDGLTWTYLYDLSAAVGHDMTNARFINVSMVEVDAADYPGQLPYSSGAIVLIWGSGAYRKSSPCLACVPSAQIENKSSLRYFSGLDAGDMPLWSANESDAAYLFDHDQVGEFSTAWIAQIQRWIILYHALTPRGVTLRTAQKPWGPYSPGHVILHPWDDGGYGRFMHVSWDWGHRDAFHEPGRENVWGGGYGPYIIPRFTEGDADRCWIYYTLSTWNPYQVIVVRSEIGEPLPAPPGDAIIEHIMPGDASWNRTSDDFYTTFSHNSVPYITTFTSAGDAATGMMWRWLPRDARNVRLYFEVHGGRAEVLLVEGGGDIPTTTVPDTMELYDRIKRGDYGDVVQCTWAHNSNSIDVPIDWRLSPFDSANLKVVVVDPFSAVGWNFVSVSRMTLMRHPPNPETSAARWTSY